jgi:hypothetical protein
MTVPIRTQIKEKIKTLVQGVVFPSAVQGRTSFVSVSRKLLMFNNIDPSAQPCSFVVQHGELYDSKHVGVPPRRQMLVSIWSFAYPGEAVDGDDYLDSMEEGLESALNISDDPMTNSLTLDGLAYYAQLDRTSNLMIRDPGDLDGQALLVLPFKIMMP